MKLIQGYARQHPTYGSGYRVLLFLDSTEVSARVLSPVTLLASHVELGEITDADRKSTVPVSGSRFVRLVELELPPRVAGLHDLMERNANDYREFGVPYDRDVVADTLRILALIKNPPPTRARGRTMP